MGNLIHLIQIGLLIADLILIGVSINNIRILHMLEKELDKEKEKILCEVQDVDTKDIPTEL